MSAEAAHEPQLRDELRAEAFIALRSQYRDTLFGGDVDSSFCPDAPFRELPVEAQQALWAADLVNENNISLNTRVDLIRSTGKRFGRLATKEELETLENLAKQYYVGLEHVDQIVKSL